MHAKFALGQVNVTRGAALSMDHTDVMIALARHVSGDWGETSRSDCIANDWAVDNGERIVSVYCDRLGTKFRIVTEHDRSMTTVTLLEDC